MYEFEASPKQLKRLFDHTHQALRLYYNKEKWPAIYPTLTQLAERFVLMYNHTPNALHAHLQFYAADHGYTTNLVVNQCIVICALCHANGYSSQFTEELVLACLSDHICSTNETNRLANAKSLNVQEQKLLKLRHQIAIKMLKSAKVPSGQLQRILARLDKYTAAITGVKHIPLYDNTTVLVCLAKRISKAITPRPKVRTFNITQTIKSLYVNTHNQFAQSSLTALAQQFAHYPTGVMVNYKSDHAMVLAKANKSITLGILKDNKVAGVVKTSKQLSPFYKPIITTDKTLLYSIWFNDQVIELPQREHNNKDMILEAVGKLGQEQYIEFKAIEKTIAPFTQLEQALRHAARQYNRQGQKATTLRHCLTMVGLDTAGLLCQRVLLETLLAEQPHPFSADIWCKYTLINKIIFVLLSKSKPESFEALLGPFTAVIYFIVLNHDSQIMRLVTPPSDDFSQIPISTACIFGFEQLDGSLLNEFVQDNFRFSKMHNAFAETELTEKQSLSVDAKLFSAIKLITVIILTGETQLTAWQSQVLDSILDEFNWQSRTQILTAILEQSPLCTIE
ncbi:hypothetical protein [Pseudoalteromonas aurantia]|uniref:Uncharacterized protein n=2 Tax=Pseudoalteromonas TaxID=53246 RepID=A0A5S3V8X0_9GAMM|nr:hypothetical protein [Pseudoalteromonas aurantia]TMO64978.1 hypothetical protein CWC18_05740 [Pseudoalteromonas aurantia]TMO68245.1 hypothetical protein CWC19_10410 [Pseudoalteromonas aurantia]TMO72544.1 hypothetical protein CWC20_14975 [Pseudoalteromonas aurantia]